MLKIVDPVRQTAIARPTFVKEKALVQPPNFENIIKELEDFVRSKEHFLSEFSKEEIVFCKTVEIPDRFTRQKLIDLIFSEKLKDEPVAEAFASNENIISNSDEAMEIFVRLTEVPPSREARIGRRFYISNDESDPFKTKNGSRIDKETDPVEEDGLYFGDSDPPALNVSVVQKGFCINAKIIPLDRCQRDVDRREKITDYIMQNSHKPIANFLAQNENLSRCEGIVGLQTWAEEFSDSPVRATSTTAVNIIENLRRQRKKLQVSDNGKSLSSATSKGSAGDEAPKQSVIKIIDRIKDNPKGAALDRKDRLSLMSYAQYLIGMEGGEEKLVFELMQNPNILTSKTWNTTISKTNFCFLKGKSDHGFVLGLALNEQKNNIDDFRKALLQLAVKYSRTEFAKNVVSGLTEFNKEDLQLISALLKHNQGFRAILLKNKSYQAAVRKLKTAE